MDEHRASDRLGRAFLHHAEVRAERLIAWLRLATAAILASVALTSTQALESVQGISGAWLLWPSLVSVAGFTTLSIVAIVVIGAGLYRPWMAGLIAAADVALALAALAEGAQLYGLAGNFLFLLPSAPLATLVLAFNALRFRPLIVAGAATAYALGATVIAYSAGFGLAAPALPATAGRFADLPPNLLRLAALALTGVVLTLAVVRGKRLLERVLAEARERQELTRFLPGHIAADLAREESRLREGINIDCAVLFVDMRDSTRITERMDPRKVADFLTRFRRRITRAVEAHDGLIEKFTGDGALIIFGAPRSGEDDARRALVCAIDLVSAIDEWNEDRHPNSPLSIVVGVHAGSCFCGVVGGEESRLEFTVIGDPVNVAARLEVLAKEHDEAIIASADVLGRAGIDPDGASWRRLGTTPLRGRKEPVEIFAYTDGDRPEGSGER